MTNEELILIEQHFVSTIFTPKYDFIFENKVTHKDQTAVFGNVIFVYVFDF